MACAKDERNTTPGSHGHAQHRLVEVLDSSSKEVISRGIIHVRNKAQLWQPPHQRARGHEVSCSPRWVPRTGRAEQSWFGQPQALKAGNMSRKPFKETKGFGEIGIVEKKKIHAVFRASKVRRRESSSAEGSVCIRKMILCRVLTQ